MVQEYKNIAIIGAGASGSLCAYFLLNNLTPSQPSPSREGVSITMFDKGLPLRTLLPTGGGRCNLAHAEYDPRELAKNYPRGEKFLYSVFSKFSTFIKHEVAYVISKRAYGSDPFYLKITRLCNR